MTRKLIDTTMLVYAYDKSEAIKHAVASETLKQLGESGAGVLSAQNLAEFSRALTEKAKRPLPYVVVRSYVLQLESLFDKVNYSSKTVAEALHLSATYGIHFFDALLAATMEENFITEIVTENEKDFKKVPGLVIYNPFK